jgi:hypothetical protein
VRIGVLSPVFRTADTSHSDKYAPRGPFRANELAYYGGIPINNIAGYDFDTDLDRLILRNGVKVA